MKLTLGESLAALAGLAAAVASVAGFIPGVYRDRPLVIAQSHGYDIGNLVVVAVLWIGLALSTRGSLPGRLVAIGALGCLLYGYVTYAFEVVVNPVTLLYIAVLGFGGWSFVAGLGSVDGRDIERAVATGLPRRTTGIFFGLLALFFALNWLRQLVDAGLNSALPAELASTGWPMNPVWVEDLAVVLPLLALTGRWLLIGDPRGARAAVPLLAFMALLAVTILALTAGTVVDGQALDPVLVLLFGMVLVVSTVLAAQALRRPSRAVV